MSFMDATAALTAHLASSPEVRRLAALSEGSSYDDESFLSEILGAAATLAEDKIEPFGRVTDHKGCELVGGRVRLAAGHHEAWSAYVAGGWTSTEGPVEFGGMGLPMAIHSACEELFNRASAGFGMASTSMRCASKVIERYGSAAMKAEWLPHLIDGSWGATICISEADAGSDVQRLRTMAIPRDDGAWSITGEKMWISFGDHDLTARIGHLILARTPASGAAPEGLSLFLAPSLIDGQRNAIVVRRIEEKLGLHVSPTCALGFEGAQGWLIGALGRGLPQLFTMIIGMRISVGSQGAGIAGAAADLAWRYAAERKQGGRPDAPPVSIDQHGDVRRMLLDIGARAEMARALVLTTSAMSDLQAREPDEDARRRASALLGWLLPITKTFCAEAAFSCASSAIQVLGGAGYTTEWRAEAYLRDARVLSIYEGASGMQALDLIRRRTLGEGGYPLACFTEAVRRDLAMSGETWASSQMARLLSLLEQSAAGLGKAEAQVVAYPFLQLASLATTGWLALRLTMMAGSPTRRHLAALGRHWLRIAPPQAEAEAALVMMGADLIEEFEAIEPSMF